jgi:hypothetical protein
LVKLPLKSDKTKRTKNIKKSILAILAAPAAMPPKPRIPAIIAITRKEIVHLSMIVYFYVKDLFVFIEPKTIPYQKTKKLHLRITFLFSMFPYLGKLFPILDETC